MTEATATQNDSHGGHDPHDHGHGNPYLAHHFDTMEQQYDTGKLGMWIFLATELLMFGGLFCAYSVYRANHPEVFLYAHTYLDTTMGAINTAVLLASSLTMAWAVRAAQLNQKTALVALCLATLLGGAGFMVIKAFEYGHKFHDYLGPGRTNQYNVSYEGDAARNNEFGLKKFQEELAQKQPPKLEPHGIATTAAVPYAFLDPNTGTGDAAVIKPAMTPGGGLAAPHRIKYAAGPDPEDAEIGDPSHTTAAPQSEGDAHAGLAFTDLSQQLSRQRVNTFFGIYYCMTGLHAVHVIVGMGLIFWITYRAGSTRAKAWILPLPLIAIGAYFLFLASIHFVIPTPSGYINMEKGLTVLGIIAAAIGVLWTVLRVVTFSRKPVVEGEFNETYFAPVDLVGLYWHLVDLIWIFLFPLLYLIHGNVGS